MGRQHNVKKQPIVADPKCSEMLANAADAIGISAEELCDLVIDGGYVDTKFLTESKSQMKPLTRSYTFADLGGRMFALMQQGRSETRAGFYEGLSPVARKALLIVLHSRGYSFEAIVEDLELDARYVMRVINEYADDLGAQVVGLRLNTIAGHLQLAKDRAQALELKAGNGRAVFAIEKDFVKTLQSLGVVDRAIHKVEHEHKHSFDAAAEAEVDGMVNLKLKQLQAEEDLKLIEANVMDEVPELDDDE